MCGHCHTRFCLLCGRGHHEPISCRLWAAWERFLDTQLPTGGLVRDLAAEDGRRAALKAVERREALEILWKLDGCTERVRSWAATSDADPDGLRLTRTDLLSAVEELLGLLPKLSLREDALVAQWQRLRRAELALEAALAGASGEVLRFNTKLVEAEEAARPPRAHPAAAEAGAADANALVGAGDANALAGAGDANALAGAAEVGARARRVRYQQRYIEQRHAPWLADVGPPPADDGFAYEEYPAYPYGEEDLWEEREYAYNPGWRPRRLPEREPGRRAGRILQAAAVALLQDLADRLVLAGFRSSESSRGPAEGGRAAARGGSALRRSLQLAAQVLLREGSVRTRLARLARGGRVETAGPELEWRALVARAGAGVEDALAGLKREATSYTRLAEAESRIRSIAGCRKP